MSILDRCAQPALERWNAAMMAVCGHYDTDLAFNRSLFIGEISTFERGGIALASLRTNAGNIRRNVARADRDDDSQCFLISQRRGHACVTQNGVVHHLAPGDLMLMDGAGTCEITPEGLIEHVSLSLPRDEVARNTGQQGALHGKLSATSACGRMLHLLMDQLCRETTEGGALQGEGVQNALLALIGPALGAEDAAPVHLPGQAGGLRDYVQRVIDESLTQPNLTPQGLAERLNISVRQLYRVFEEQGDSVCRYIQRTRLQRSASDLQNPRLKHESITAIAYKWGFTDSAHFSRSFKKQFEVSPKDYRRAEFA